MRVECNMRANKLAGHNNYFEKENVLVVDWKNHEMMIVIMVLVIMPEVTVRAHLDF